MNVVGIKSESQQKRITHVVKVEKEVNAKEQLGNFGKRDVQNVAASLRAENGGDKGDGKKGKAHKR